LDIVRPIRAVAKAAIFFLKVFPMLPSQPVDWVTKSPVVQKVRYPTCSGSTEGDLYRPVEDDPHPGIVVCLGVVPFGVDHPQVPILGKALARAGFVALIYWSPAMRDFRLEPTDVENISLAYQWLIVSNEVSLGLIPPYPIGRIYRDALGRANQKLAQSAHRTIWMVAGIPTIISNTIGG
jgi:hypothetical protein